MNVLLILQSMVVVNIRAKLIAKHTDVFNYTTYAFQNVDSNEYVLCTRFPNWEHPTIEIGEIGILQFKEVIAGEDKWYNGETMIPYNYTGWHFVKFVPIKENVDDIIITQNI